MFGMSLHCGGTAPGNMDVLFEGPNGLYVETQCVPPCAHICGTLHLATIWEVSMDFDRSRRCFSRSRLRST